MEKDYNYQAPDAGDTSYGGAKHVSLAEQHASCGDLKRFRISKRESQEKFWGRFGVTQSSGSRFETGLGIPPPVAILVKLYLAGKLNDGDFLA